MRRVLAGGGGGGGGGAVASVNGKTGAVTLAPSDIGAATAGILTTGLITEYALHEGAGVAIGNSARPLPIGSPNLFHATEGLFSVGTIWGGAAANCTDRVAMDPFGGDMATRFLVPAGTSNVLLTQYFATAAGTDYTLSLYVKSNTGAAQTMRGFDNAQHGFTGNITIPATGWVRITNQFTNSGGAGTGQAGFGNDATATALDVLIYGMKLEQGTTATPYAPAATHLGLTTATATPTWSGETLDITDGASYALGAIPSVRLQRASLYAVCRSPVGTPLAFSALISGDYPNGPMLSAADDVNPGARFASLSAVGHEANVNDGRWHVMAATYDGTTLRCYQDGFEIASGAGANLSALVTVLQLGCLNFAQQGTAFPFPGQIAHTLAYNVAHTPAQVRANIAALTTIAAARSPSIVVAPLTKLIAYEGDSIMAGALSNTGGYPHLVATNRMTGTAIVSGRSFAVAGAAIGPADGSQSNTVNQRAPLVDALLTANPSSRSVLFVNIGHNDLAQNGATASGVFAALKAYCLARRAAGWNRVVVSTILPSTGATANPLRNSLNTLIKGDTSFYDYLCDFAANATMGPDAAASNTTYYADGVHPTAAGDAILADAAWATLQLALA